MRGERERELRGTEGERKERRRMKRHTREIKREITNSG